MALGGGVFLTQNKILPGTYINFVSAARATASLADRGFAAMPVELSWGPESEVFTVTQEDFQKDSQKLFGYAYTSEKLRGFRDLFLNLRQGYFYRLNSGGVKAACALAEAKYPGLRGNDLRLVVEANEASTEEKPLFDVSTFLEGQLVGEQKAVSATSELTANDFAVFKADASLSLTAGMPLTGGTDGIVADASYQAFLDKIEAYSFNILGCLSKNDTIKALFAAFTKRMRDQVGVKFQTVLHNYSKADYEGVISVKNGVAGDAGDASAVWWVVGAEAGCAVNRSCLNKAYDGEFAIDAKCTQAELEAALKAGEFVFHRVGDSIRVLDDRNTFQTTTVDKSEDFAQNQTVRVLDQIGNDIAALFANKYLGQYPNDDAGRVSLWNDIVAHHQELARLRAIENFDPEAVSVERGATKKAVAVTDMVMPVNAMAQLYMTVTVQ